LVDVYKVASPAAATIAMPLLEHATAVHPLFGTSGVAHVAPALVEIDSGPVINGPPHPYEYDPATITFPSDEQAIACQTPLDMAAACQDAPELVDK
jgi:hypothetical protein